MSAFEYMLCCAFDDVKSAIRFYSVLFYQTDVKIRLLIELPIPDFDCAPSLFRLCSSVSVLERKAQVGKSEAQVHICRGC